MSGPGRPGSAAIRLAFRDFYLARKAAGLPVEKPRVRMARVEELTETDIRQLILAMPFKKFAQRGFLSYDRDASRLRFSPVLLHRLSPADLDRLRGSADEAAERYFSRLSIANDCAERRAVRTDDRNSDKLKRDQTKDIESARRIAQEWLKTHP